MKILAIMGSPRKGDTYEVIRLIEKKIKSLGGAEFEYLWLKDAHLESCVGCGACLTKGEKFCPLEDDRGKVESVMRACDGVIFVSPVYVVNVTALMKNFMDRFAYVCHRPRFFDKYAMLVSTAGGFGLAQTLQALDWAARTWGFNIVSKLGIISLASSSAALRIRSERQIERVSTGFYNAIRDKKKFSPEVSGIVAFEFQKKAFARADKDSADFTYWEEKGWLKSDARYYFPVKINFFKRLVALTVIKVLQLA